MKKYVFKFYDSFLDRNRHIFLESGDSPEAMLSAINSQLSEQRMKKGSLFAAADPDEIVKVGNLEIKSSGFPKEVKPNSFKIMDYNSFFERNKNKELS